MPPLQNKEKRASSLVDVSAMNSYPEQQPAACSLVHGMREAVVAFDWDFEAGREYVVQVNGVGMARFTGQ